MATSREMTEGRALPLIFNFTLPLLLGNLLQQTYSLVDAAIVGRFLGINALASVGASTSVIFLFWDSAMAVAEVSAFPWRKSSVRGIMSRCAVMWLSACSWLR